MRGSLRTVLKAVIVLMLMVCLIANIAMGISSGVSTVFSLMGAALCTLFVRLKLKIAPPSRKLLFFMVLAAAAGWLLGPLVVEVIVKILMAVVGVFAWLVAVLLMLWMPFLVARQGAAAAQNARSLIETGSHRALSAEERYQLQQAVTHHHISQDVLHSGMGERVMDENRIKR